MPVNAFQEKALGLLLSDPEASLDLQKHLNRIDKTIPLSNLPDLAFQQKLDAAVNPIKAELEETKKKLLEKATLDTHEHEAEKLRRLGWKEDQIEELRKRMKEDPDGNFYGNYLAAAKYYQAMDQPALPRSGNARDVGLSGHSRKEDQWREDFENPESDLRKAAISGNRRAAKKDAAKRWDEARMAFRNR
jgi:hypothetical protein